MKNKIKKNLYYFSYAIVLLLISLFETDHFGVDLNFLIISNTLIFAIIDVLLLKIIMTFLKRESYILQQRVVTFYKTWNNLILLIILLYTNLEMRSLWSDIVLFTFLSFVIHYVLNFLILPIPQDPEVGNGIEEFFNKYPKRKKGRFYKDTDEIKTEYNPLKREIETEMPVMAVKAEDQRKEKRKKLLSYLMPAFLTIFIVIGLFYGFVENVKQFNRGNYHHFEASLNSKAINVYYEQKYKKTIIPVLYTQSGYNSSYLIYGVKYEDSISEVEVQDQYILELKEYICYDKKIRVQCGINNVSSRQEKELSDSEMYIQYNDDLDKIIYQRKSDSSDFIYAGKYISDLNPYIVEKGFYVISITNEEEHIKNDIKIIIHVIDKKE